MFSSGDALPTKANTSCPTVSKEKHTKPASIIEAMFHEESVFHNITLSVDYCTYTLLDVHNIIIT